MAANLFDRRIHGLIPVVVYALLEWILIVLLLGNGLLSFVVAWFADFFGLHPPCVFCSRIDHLFAGGGDGSIASAARRGLFCDAHATEISDLGFCSDHRRLRGAAAMCRSCSSSLPSPPVKLLPAPKETTEEFRCACCDSGSEIPQLHSNLLSKLPREVMRCAQGGKSFWEKAAAAKISPAQEEMTGGAVGRGEWMSPGGPVPAVNGGGDDGNLQGKNESLLAQEDCADNTCRSPDDLHGAVDESADGSVAAELEGGSLLDPDELAAALMAARRSLGALYRELEEERSASAIAANQTMAMITRLQEEKAAMQMEALQYQRMMEAQSEHDEEALELLNELLNRREKERRELEGELRLLRKKVILYESEERKRLKDAARGSAPSSSSDTDEGDDLSGRESENRPADLEEGRLSGAVLDDRDEPPGRAPGRWNGEGDEEFWFTRIGGGSGHGCGGSSRTREGSRGKALLPLFDAVCMESGANITQGSASQTKLAVSEEVRELYKSS